MDWIHKHLLGYETPARPGLSTGWLIRLYALQRWRGDCVLSHAGTCTRSGRFSCLGGVIATGLLGLAWGVPIPDDSVPHDADIHANESIEDGLSYGRDCRGRIVGGTFLATRPGRVDAPAVVEYAPLTVIRAATPGFVPQIQVASGQQVKAGQGIAVLQNKELEADLSDLGSGPAAVHHPRPDESAKR